MGGEVVWKVFCHVNLGWEMVWRVVLADGELHEYESQLMRRLAGLLYVDDIDSGRAAKRARARLSQDG